MIYLLTVNYYSTSLITKLINSIQSLKNTPYQIVIINNSPDDSSIQQLKSESVLILEAEANLGFGRACNMGLSWIYAQNPKAIVWLINPDACLVKNTLDKVVPFFEAHPQLSIVGTMIYTPTGRIWFAGGCFIPSKGAILDSDLLTHSDEAYVFSDWVSACSLLLNLRNFRNCPQFDPAYFLYYEDFDFCKRYAKQGHSIAVTQQLGAIHQPSAIANRNMFTKIKHSTYSYLLTLEKYTNPFILLLRLTRLLAYALVLIPVKPEVAFGKLYGVSLYLRRRQPS